MIFQPLIDVIDIATGNGWMELPESYGGRVFALAKGAGHRYIRRVPKAGGGYRYYYHVGHGGGVANTDHFVEGAAFQHDGGHFHVKAVDGDKLTIEHDETGEKKTVSKSQLRGMLTERHGKELDAHRAKVHADLADAKKAGASAKQIARLEARAKAVGGESRPDVVVHKSELSYEERRHEEHTKEADEAKAKIEEIKRELPSILQHNPILDSAMKYGANESKHKGLPPRATAKTHKKLSDEERRALNYAAYRIETEAERHLRPSWAEGDAKAHQNMRHQRAHRHIQDHVGSDTAGALANTDAFQKYVKDGGELRMSELVDSFKARSKDGLKPPGGHNEHSARIHEYEHRVLSDLADAGHYTDDGHLAKLKEAAKAGRDAHEANAKKWADYKANEERIKQEAQDAKKAEEAAAKAQAEAANAADEAEGTAALAAKVGTLKEPGEFKVASKPLDGNKAHARAKAFASKDETRPSINAVHSDGKGNMVATDGHRLAIIPTSHMETKNHSKDGLGVDSGEGFPAWRKVVDPNPPTKVAHFDADSLRAALTAIKDAKAARGQSSKMPRIVELMPDGRVVDQGTNGKTHGTVSVPARGEIHGARVNAQYLLDAIKGAKGTVQIGTSDANRNPVHVRRQDGEHHIVMPVYRD